MKRRSLLVDPQILFELFQCLGPSLGFWRAVEIAALCEQEYRHPILDLGCGDGLVTSYVLTSVDLGLDPYLKDLERAAERGVYQQLQAVTVEKAEIEPSSFQTVLSNSVLEHLPDPDQVLRVIADILAPGGKLIFTVPTEAFGRWLVLPFTRYGAWRNWQYEHRNLWTVKEWAKHLNKAGLEIVQVRPYMSHKMVAIWDALELLQRVWIGQHRLAGVIWQRIPPPVLKRIAVRVSRVNLDTGEPGGGRLIAARKR